MWTSCEKRCVGCARSGSHERSRGKCGEPFPHHGASPGDNGQKGEVLHHVGAWFEWRQVAQTCGNTWERKRGGLEVQGDWRSRKNVSKILVSSIFG